MAEFTEVLERRFRVTGMPRLEVHNVAGETIVRGGTGEEVVVRATKRAQADSPDRARRVLENVDVHIEQDGDDIRVSQRAFLIERGWMGLFRERRAVVDYEIEVPGHAEVAVRSTSGDVELRGVEGPVELQTVSGDIAVEGARGPLRLRTVSGDCRARSCAGGLEANSVSGDFRFEECNVPSALVRTVSGDVEAAMLLSGEGPYGVTTVSGDVALASPSSYELHFHTMSGDLQAQGAARVERLSRRELVARLGDGGPGVDVRTVSGDVRLERRDVDGPAAPPPSHAAAARRDRRAAAMEVLERLRRGDVDVDEAARLLDSAR